MKIHVHFHDGPSVAELKRLSDLARDKWRAAEKLRGYHNAPALEKLYNEAYDRWSEAWAGED